MYIEYFLVTFGYSIVPINGINFTEDVHTDSHYLHDGSISIFVLLFHMSLDECIWDVACCDILTFLYFNHCSNSVPWSDSLLCQAPYMCMLPFAQCWDFIIWSFFSVKNRSDSIALCLLDLLCKHLWTGLKHDLLCSCFISL